MSYLFFIIGIILAGVSLTMLTLMVGDALADAIEKI